VAVALAALSASRPCAADESDDLRGEMLGGGPGRWRAVFRKMEANAALLGRTLGPIFRDRSERVRPLSAWAAAALCDRAARRGEEPLLSDEILRRAAGDVAYVAEMRANLDGDGGGWTALVSVGRRRLLDAASDPADRSAAAFLLRYEATKQNAFDLTTAWETAPRQVADAAAESLQWLLVTRFDGPKAARAFFTEHARDSFVDWIRAASAAKDRPDAPLRVRLVEEARRNVERAATPAELEPYLSVEATPYVEVRRAAAKRAAKVDAAPEAWLPLLVKVVRHEDDQETLLGLLDAAKRLKVTDREKAQDLSKAILARLGENRGSGPLDLGLVNLLATVADREAATTAFEILRADADPEMLDALLSLAGGVGGTEALVTSFHASLAGRNDPVSIRLRVRALDALARGATASANAEVAGGYVRAVLRRDDATPGEAGLPRETSPDGRRAAVLALQAFPGPATAARLADVVRADGEESSGRPEDGGVPRLALGVLGRLASGGDADAALALVGLARDPSLRTGRIEALRALARLPAETSEDLLAQAKGAVRTALGADSARDVRLAAAEAAEALGDEGALAGILSLALEQARETPGTIGPVAPRLEGLVRRLVRAGPGSDATIAVALRLVAAAGAVEPAVAIGNAAAEEGQGRLTLQVARAGLLEIRAAAASVPGDRVRTRQDAERILRTATAAVPASERTGTPWSGALSLRRSLLDALIADEALLAPEDRKAAYLARVDVAVTIADPGDAPTALDVARRARGLELTPEESALLDEGVEALRKLSPE
jgi:hypothetical protein